MDYFTYAIMFFTTSFGFIFPYVDNMFYGERGFRLFLISIGFGVIGFVAGYIVSYAIVFFAILILLAVIFRRNNGNRNKVKRETENDDK